MKLNVSRVIAQCLIFIFVCLIIPDIVIDASSPHWTDLNRVTVLDNSSYPNRHKSRNDVPKSQETSKNNYNLPYKHVEDNKEYSNWNNYEPKPLRPSFRSSNVLPLKHPKQFHNWNGGYYKTHQRGSASIPYNGATVKIPATRGSKKAYRGTITTTIITPDELKHNSRHRSNHHENYLRDEPARNPDPCVMCPEERTLITNWKKDKVILPMPKLKSCDGKYLNDEYEFKSIFGPKPGEFLTAGSHILLGRIYRNEEAIQTCQLKVNVLVRKCHHLNIPENILADCDAGNTWGSTCTFACLNPDERIRGSNTVHCDQHLKWNGEIPECKRTSSCLMPETPLNSKILCNMPDAEQNMPGEIGELPESTRCRIQCNHGYRLVRRNASVVSTCRSGYWDRRLHARCVRKSANAINEK